MELNSSDSTRIGQDAKIFNLLIEFLYPPKSLIVDHATHVIHVQRTTPTTSIVKSLVGKEAFPEDFVSSCVIRH